MVIELIGTVSMQHVAVGSKSARSAPMLDTADGLTYILRRRGGNAFADPMLNAFAGKQVRVTGKLVSGNTLIADTIVEVPR